MFSKLLVAALCISGLLVGGVALGDENALETPSSATAQASEVSASDGPYTSLIVDASGLQLQRCMSPKLRRPDGTEVWGTVKVDDDAVQDSGIVVYASTLEEARKHQRCGSNPFVVKAVAVQGNRCKTDPIVSAEDAKAILAENGKGHFLDKFKVIFVKGAQAGNTGQPAARAESEKGCAKSSARGLGGKLIKVSLAAATGVNRLLPAPIRPARLIGL